MPPDKIEDNANRIVEDFKNLSRTGLKALINDIQDIQKENPNEFKAILAAANPKLDKAIPEKFGTLDLVGAQDGKLLLENTETNETSELSPNGDRAVTSRDGSKKIITNNDGSRVTCEKQGDGKLHPVKVEKPNGSYVDYTYDAMGQPTSFTEFERVYGARGKPEIKKTAQYELTAPKVFTKKFGAPTAPERLPGQLTVTDDGQHIFENSQDNTKMVRKPNGAIEVTNKDGVPLWSTPPIPKGR